MNQIEEALFRSGAHIAFKQSRPNPPHNLPNELIYLNGSKVVDIKEKRNPTKKTRQRIIGGIPLDPVNKIAAIVTSRNPNR